MSVSSPARTGLKAAFAAAGAVALMSTGVAFAASGHTPWSGASAGPASSTNAADPTHPVHPTHPAHPSGGPTDGATHSTGPNAHAFAGLCRAYVSGHKADHGKALESPAFVALVSAAGGADNVATFCGTQTTAPTEDVSTDSEDAASPTHPAHPTHPTKPTQAASPTHPAHPTHPTKPTQAASPTHPTHPTHPTRPTDKPSKTTHPTP